MTEHLPFHGAPLKVFTIIFPRLSDGRLLLLRRSKDRPFLPGFLMGFGGKVDPGETLEHAAERELKEETGLTGTLTYRGCYAYTTTTTGNPGGVIHIYMADALQGEVAGDLHEGTPAILTVDEALADPCMAPDNKHQLRLAMESHNTFFCMGRWVDGQLTDWGESTGYYAERAAAPKAA